VWEATEKKGGVRTIWNHMCKSPSILLSPYSSFEEIWTTLKCDLHMYKHDDGTNRFYVRVGVNRPKPLMIGYLTRLQQINHMLKLL